MKDDGRQGRPGPGRRSIDHPGAADRRRMQELDARVDLDKKDPAEVAKEYLQETGLVAAG